MIADRKDFIGGLLIIATGIGISLYAYMNYSLGTIQRMGPGMFPFGAGLALALFGVLIIIPALIRSSGEDTDSIPIKPMILILLSVVGFAVTISYLGLGPAIAVAVILSSLADKRFKMLHVSILTIGVAILVYLIFIVGLNLPIQMFRSPL